MAFIIHLKRPHTDSRFKTSYTFFWTKVALIRLASNTVIEQLEKTYKDIQL